MNKEILTMLSLIGAFEFYIDYKLISENKINLFK